MRHHPASAILTVQEVFGTNGEEADGAAIPVHDAWGRPRHPNPNHPNPGRRSYFRAKNAEADQAAKRAEYPAAPRPP